MDRGEDLVSVRALLLAALGAGVLGCAAERKVQPAAADARLDIVGRTLAYVSAAYDSAQGAPKEREELRLALADAQESLYQAQRAVDAWRVGDPREWRQVRPCLAIDLRRVDDALVALWIAPPPGLTQVVPLQRLDTCADGRPRAR